MFVAVNAKLSAMGLVQKAGPAVDGTLITAPSPTRNSTGTRDLETHQILNGNN